ncbi:MAG TPA: cytochrome c maturation protein CcmE [Gaiellaceae bacterium]|nr:cytochrome c maturation protein CcmE [Gaiellaceae bacterium]
MARRRASPSRLVIALAVASMLGIFLIYTAIAGGTPQVRPSQLQDHRGQVALVGKVVGTVTGDARGAGLHFRMRDVKGESSIRVVYWGSVPDMFRTGRDVSLRGKLRGDTFVAIPNTLVTKCPSKYTDKKPT